MKRFLLLSIVVALALLCRVTDAIAFDRQWTVYLVHHTHTDIGYTRPQAEIISEHLRYIDYVVDYCEMTADYPDDAKFRWTCESAWIVARYLESRPQDQVRRFVKCINDGQIEVTAMGFNMAETADENNLRSSLEALEVLHSHGIFPVTAMQNDVNGIAWSFADWLPQLGVRYLWMGEHPHKAYAPFDKPSVFHWESPSGNGLLTYRSDHYMTGNYWGIEACDTMRFASGLENYLNSLKDRQYQFDAVAVPYSGAYTDNAPPSVKVCDFIRRWNETHDNPKLRSALSCEFPEYIESEYPELLRTFRCAWPDWWTDGFASAALETEVARNAQASLNGVEGLLTQAVLTDRGMPAGCSVKIAAINSNLLFYNEHTFGASESISDPFCHNSRIQWMSKASFSWSADRDVSLLREAAAARLQAGFSDRNCPVLAVFNNLAWERDCYVDVFVDYEIIPRGKPFRAVSEDGDVLPVQTLSFRNEGRTMRFYVKDLPALGCRNFKLELCGDISPDAVETEVGTSRLENSRFIVTIDERRGCISGIFDKQRGVELADPESEYGMGQFIYETLRDRWSLARMQGEGLERSVLENCSAGNVVKGGVFDSITLMGYSSQAAGNTPVRCEIRLYHDSPDIELVYTVRRTANTSADAVYVAFPFAGGPSSLSFDVQGGEVQPGVNQLEGTSSEWNTIQNYVSIRNLPETGQSLLVMPDTPMAQLGDMLGGRFQYFKEYERPYVFSWVMNNYWTTNFKAEQEGEFSWRYVISVCDDALAGTALRHSLEERTAALARVIPASSGSSVSGKSVNIGNILEVVPSDVVPVNVRPSVDGKYILLCVRETSGRDGCLSVKVRGRIEKFRVTDAVGNPTGRRVSSAVIPAFSNMTVRIDL